MQDVNVPGADLSRTPVIRVDDAGWATIVWSELSADHRDERILVSRRPPGGAWQVPQEVGTTHSQQPFFSDLDLAVGTGGHAMVTWRRSDLRHPTRPWVAYFDPATGWSAPEDMRVAGYEVTYPASVAVNASGEGLVSWLTNGVVFTRFYRPHRGWLRTERMDDPKVDTSSITTHSAINDAGDAAVSWRAWQPTGARYDRIAGAWEYKRLSSHGLVRDGFIPSLAITPGGDIFAAWAEKLDNHSKLGAFVAHYAAGEGWQPTERVSGHSYQSNQAAVTANAQGEALVSWNVRAYKHEQRIEAARYVPGRGWGEPTRLSFKNSAHQTTPSLGEAGIGTVTQTQFIDDGDFEYHSVTTAYTLRSGGDAPDEDAIVGLGHAVSAHASPGGHVAALGATHDTFDGYSKGQLRASVREPTCGAPSAAR